MADMVDRSSEHISVTVHMTREKFLCLVSLSSEEPISAGYTICGLHDLYAVHLLKHISMTSIVYHLFMISRAGLKQGSLVAFPTILSSLSCLSSRYHCRRHLLNHHHGHDHQVIIIFVESYFFCFVQA